MVGIIKKGKGESNVFRIDVFRHSGGLVPEGTRADYIIDLGGGDIPDGQGLILFIGPSEEKEKGQDIPVPF